MKTAVILTGALRTIKKTIIYLKKNVLLNSDVNVFICVQNDTALSDLEWDKWFQEQIGDYIKTTTWFSLEKYKEWIVHRDLLLEHIPIENNWKGYLKNSGSMIEYFQLQLAYMKLCYYEQVNKFRYDYIIRARTDSIYAKPIDFHWLEWTDSDVKERIEKIKKELLISNIDVNPINIFKYFMCTIISDELIPNIQFILADYSPSEIDTLPNDINQYIKNGRYILTIRKNNLYIVKRSYFYLIPSLGTMYGLFKSPNSDDYWFNAEGQFRDACYYSCLTIFDYSTLFEEKSLEYSNKWNEADFFDLQFNCINPRMLYCVVRK